MAPKDQAGDGRPTGEYEAQTEAFGSAGGQLRQIGNPPTDLACVVRRLVRYSEPAPPRAAVGRSVRTLAS
jgi:hypothetical protein